MGNRDEFEGTDMSAALTADAVVASETSEPNERVRASRRDFAALFGLLGGAVGASMLTGCATPGADGAGFGGGGDAGVGGGGDAGEFGSNAAGLTGTTNYQWVTCIGTPATPLTASLRTINPGSAASTRGRMAFVSGFWVEGDGGGGIFYWDPTPAPDNVGLRVNPTATAANPTISAPGWVRVVPNGQLNVRWFGAKGDGMTNDQPSLQAAMDTATAVGLDVVLPTGFYRVTSTVNVGKQILNDYGPIVTRTGLLSDTYFVANFNTTNLGTNQSLRRVAIAFGAEAYLIADFVAATPTPALAYNLDNDVCHGSITGCRVIGPAAFVGSRYKQTDISPNLSANTMGVFLFRGCVEFSDGLLTGLQYGLVTAGAFWTSTRNVHAFFCGDAFHFGAANAITVSNLTAQYCKRGLVFDGTSSHLSGIHTQQTEHLDLVVLAADTCSFGPAYMEDGTGGDRSAEAFVTLGGVGAGRWVTACVFTGIHTGGPASSTKRSLRMVNARDTTFIGCRIGNTLVESSGQPEPSYGQIIGCNFEIPGIFWAKLSGGLSANGGILTQNSQLTSYGSMGFIISGANFGTIAPLGTNTYNLALAAPIVVSYSHYVARVQTTVDASDLVQVTARILDASTIQLRATNPTATAISYWCVGSVTLDLRA